MKKATFEFGLPLVKAYKTAEGAMRVVGIASDTMPDVHGDRMSAKAIKSMAAQAKGGLPLLNNHSDTFGYGKSVDARVEEDGDRKMLVVEFELDPKYPQAIDLYLDIEKGKADKQLSIGGEINPNDPKAVSYERTSDGKMVRILNEIALDHIASTRNKRAANERTGFISAIMKALEGVKAPTTATRTSPLKAAVVFKAYPLAPVTESWAFTKKDADALLGPDGGNWPRYKAAHAWFDPDADPDDPSMPEEKAAYKLPHHKLCDNKVVTVWRGVVQAAAALLGARAGADIPVEDRPGVAKHIAAHYREFGQTPPPALDALAKGKDAAMTAEEFSLFMKETNKEDISSWIDADPAAEEAVPAETPVAKAAEGEKAPEAKPEEKAPEQPATEAKPAEGVAKAEEKPAEEKPAEQAPAEVAKESKPTEPVAAPSLAERVAKAMAGGGSEVAPTTVVPATTAAPAATVEKTVVEKGMYSVTRFAELLHALSYLVSDAEYEAKQENDNSPIPAKLRGHLEAMAATFKEMAAEEVNELLAKAAPATSATVEKDKGGTVDALVAMEAVAKSVAEGAVAPILKAMEDAAALMKAFGERLTKMESDVAAVTASHEAVSKDTSAAVLAVSETVGKMKNGLETLEKVAGVSQTIVPGSGTDDVLVPAGAGGGDAVNKSGDDEGTSLWKGVLGSAVDQFLRGRGQTKARPAK